jgi:hypothetical protein
MQILGSLMHTCITNALRTQLISYASELIINRKIFMKMTAFWDVAPCCLVDVDRRFRGAYCLHHLSPLTALPWQRLLQHTHHNYCHIRPKIPQQQVITNQPTFAYYVDRFCFRVNT